MKQSIHADISSLDVIVHQEAIVSVISLMERLSKSLADVSSTSITTNVIDLETMSIRSVSSTDSARRRVKTNQQGLSTVVFIYDFINEIPVKPKSKISKLFILLFSCI